MTTYFKCPRCNAFSGDDWSQCHGYCPVDQSPDYNETANKEYGGLIPYTQEEFDKYMQDDWRR